MCTRYAGDGIQARMFGKVMFLVRDWEHDDESPDTLDEMVCW